jgi:p-hydroxybenzoate 3-monooxygenase
MLHALPDGDRYDRRRQVAELRSVVKSKAAATYLAEGYTGWPQG